MESGKKASAGKPDRHYLVVMARNVRVGDVWESRTGHRTRREITSILRVYGKVRSISFTTSGSDSGTDTPLHFARWIVRANAFRSG